MRITAPSIFFFCASYRISLLAVFFIPSYETEKSTRGVAVTEELLLPEVLLLLPEVLLLLPEVLLLLPEVLLLLPEVLLLLPEVLLLLPEVLLLLLEVLLLLPVELLLFFWMPFDELVMDGMSLGWLLLHAARLRTIIVAALTFLKDIDISFAMS